MSARRWLTAILLASSAASGVLQGCSGNTPPIAPILDSGGDSLEELEPMLDARTGTDRDERDVAPDRVADIPDTASEACAVDADLETIPIPDASLGAGATTGQCLGCAKTSCNAYLETCNSDCACKEAVIGLVACVASGTPFLTCAAYAATEPNAEALGLCVYSSCGGACGISSPADGGVDSAPGDVGTSSDGSADAPHEAGKDSPAPG